MVDIEANTIGGASVEQVLPNHRTQLGGNDISVTDALVLATIRGAELGRGHLPPTGDGSEQGRQVDALSDEAAWRSVYLTIDVEEVIGHSAIAIEAGDRIRVGLTLDGGPIDSEAVLASLEGLKEGVFFLKELPFGVDGVAEILHLAHAGASTMAIGEDGTLSLPLYTQQAEVLVSERLSSVPAAGPVPTDLTLESLREMASAPVVVDRLDG